MLIGRLAVTITAIPSVAERRCRHADRTELRWPRMDAQPTRPRTRAEQCVLGPHAVLPEPQPREAALPIAALGRSAVEIARVTCEVHGVVAEAFVEAAEQRGVEDNVAGHRC